MVTMLLSCFFYTNLNLWSTEELEFSNAKHQYTDFVHISGPRLLVNSGTQDHSWMGMYKI